jgi:hypothetical protein
VRFLPVAGAEHHDLGRGVEAGDVLTAQFAHVQIEVEDGIVAAACQALGDPSKSLGAVPEGGKAVVRGSEGAHQQGGQNRSHNQVADRPGLGRTNAGCRRCLLRADPEES